MIKSIQHKGLEQFFRTGSKAVIQPHLAVLLSLYMPHSNPLHDRDPSRKGKSLLPWTILQVKNQFWEVDLLNQKDLDFPSLRLSKIRLKKAILAGDTSLVTV
jgi:hypothetical protein